MPAMAPWYATADSRDSIQSSKSCDELFPIQRHPAAPDFIAGSLRYWRTRSSRRTPSPISCAHAGQRIWQVLPLGPTGYGDSPYQCFSAFAGNPLLISIDGLVEHGYLDARRRLRHSRVFPDDKVDFGAVIAWKLPLLRKAFKNFQRGASGGSRGLSRHFCQRHASWLDDFALFMALKDAHDLVIWTEWERELALREPAALARARNELRDEIECNKFIQFEFERQWCDLKAHCARNDIRIMGDMPIYVALDSADVWVQPRTVRAEGRWQAARSGRRSARLLQRHRSALGQSDLPLGGARHAPATRGGSRASGVRWRCST